MGDDARLSAEAPLLHLQEGTELDEGGEATARHVRNSVLETLIQSSKNIVDEVAVLDARAEIAESVRHVLHLGGVLDDREFTLVEAAELVTEESGARVAVFAEDGADGTPEGKSGGVPGLHDLQGGGGDRGVVPRDDGEVVEGPIRVALGGGAVDVVTETKLGEGGEELATP